MYLFKSQKHSKGFVAYCMIITALTLTKQHSLNPDWIGFKVKILHTLEHMDFLEIHIMSLVLQLTITCMVLLLSSPSLSTLFPFPILSSCCHTTTLLPVLLSCLIDKHQQKLKVSDANARAGIVDVICARDNMMAHR